MEPYLLGGTYGIDDQTTGFVACDLQYLIGPDAPCLGGNENLSAHHDDRNDGYWTAQVSVVDDLFGVQTSFTLGVLAPCDEALCPLEPTVQVPCGLPGRIDSTEAGFRFVEVKVFVDGLRVDSTTNDVCGAIGGDIAGTFS